MSDTTDDQNAQVQLLKQIKDLLTDQKNRMDGIEGSSRRIRDNQRAIHDQLSDNVDMLEQEAALYEAVGQKLPGITQQGEYLLAASKARLKIQQEEIKAASEVLDTLKAQGAEAEEMYLIHLKDIELQQKAMELEEARILHLEGQSKLVGNISGKIKGMAGIGDELGIAGQFAASIANGKGLADVLGEVKGELFTLEMGALALDATQEKLTEGMVFLFKAAWDQAKAVDAATSSMRRATGGMATYDQAITDAYQNNTLFGVTAESAGTAANNLFMQSSKFSRMQPEMQANLIESAAVLEQAGISSDAFAAGLEVSTMALGRTADEARRSQEDLLLFAREVGMSPQLMSEQFAQAGNVMAKFGYNAEKMFKNVAKAAKASGIEISRIVDYTQQFDTFEGAAEKVGSLNAMLGGDFINAMDLMATEDPAERIRMITGAINDAGKSFEEMSYYEKLALAEAAGFSDVQELAQAMTGSQNELNVSSAERALREEELAEIARTNQSTMEQLQATVAAMAPALETFMSALRTVLGILAKYKPVLALTIFALGALKVAMLAAQVKTAMATLGIKGFSLATAASTVKLKIQEAAIWAQLYAEQAFLAVKNSSTLATIRNTVAEKARTAANAIGTIGSYAAAGGRTAMTVASGAATIATNALSFATRLLGIAMMSTPIGWIIGGIMLLIGVVYLLVKNFETVKNVVSSVFGGIVKGIAFVINAWISMINVMIKAANLVPFVNIPLIPKVGQSAPEMPPALAMGAHSFGGGPALVGEEGPEMVTLPPRASVAPAKTTSPAVQTAKALASQAQGGGPAAGSGQPVNVNITLELDKRVLTKHTEEVIIKALNPAMA